MKELFGTKAVKYQRHRVVLNRNRKLDNEKRSFEKLHSEKSHSGSFRPSRSPSPSNAGKISYRPKEAGGNEKPQEKESLEKESVQTESTVQTIEETPEEVNQVEAQELPTEEVTDQQTVTKNKRKKNKKKKSEKKTLVVPQEEQSSSFWQPALLSTACVLAVSIVYSLV